MSVAFSNRMTTRQTLELQQVDIPCGFNKQDKVHAVTCLHGDKRVLRWFVLWKTSRVQLQKTLKQNKDVTIALIGTCTDEVSDRKRRIKMLQGNLMNLLESHSDLKN